MISALVLNLWRFKKYSRNPRVSDSTGLDGALAATFLNHSDDRF